MEMGFKFQMGMETGIKSLKWEGIGTKNLFPHTSIPGANVHIGGKSSFLILCILSHDSEAMYSHLCA